MAEVRDPGEEIADCEVKQETIVLVAEDLSLEISEILEISRILSLEDPALKKRKKKVVSLVEKKLEIEEKRSVSMSESGNGVESKLEDSYCFSRNSLENPIILEKERFFEVKEGESYCSVKLSGEGFDVMGYLSETGESNLEWMDGSEKPVELVSCSTRCENSSDNFLGMEEKHPLMESVLGSILEAQRTCLEEIGSKSHGESTEETNREHGSMEVEAGNADIPDNLHGCVNWVSEMEDMQEMVENDGEKMKDFNGFKSLVEIENSSPNAVTCEIPVIFPVSVFGSGNDCGKKGIGGQMNVKKNGKEGKKDKCSKRLAKGMKKVSDGNGKQNMFSLVSEARNVCLKKGDGSKISYSRNELEALRFVHVEEQQIIWTEIHHRLGPSVAQELKGMAGTKHQRQGSRNVEHHRGIVKKKEHFAVFGEVCSQDLENDFTELNPLDLSCGDFDNSNDNYIEDECTEDGDSDSDYDNIQRRAFLVEGEPDFESGPPQDGLEYLRRVRWEAAHIPKVKVAKLDRTKLTNDQIVYMPKIPDIVKCPDHLLPMKQWEDAFLADFSELRMALSCMGSGEPWNSTHPPSFLKLVEDESCQHRGNMDIQTSDYLQSIMTAEDDTSLHSETSCPESSESSHSVLMKYEEDTSQPIESSTLETSGKRQSVCANISRPALTVILRMSPVSRVSMLKKRIASFETAGLLSKNNVEWLFALCAAIDAPLDADMCASMRCLLRKCASLRAEKCEVDDEVVMLNILATISGRYFGQAEN
ncbi:uncharacterized protein LOC122659441 [Telopea speciosissima]|uniref:uncharacterized protein LOC122659441 n=1 Tax=Telopea speciosissima TaxID=54955 RepID=UPI001CC503CA|nr:uncharacterized protein LOC122659441 [Telopea speciosissima]